MKFLNWTRILGILLLIGLAVMIYFAYQIVHYDLISAAQRSLHNSLTTFLSPKMKELAEEEAAIKIVAAQEKQVSIRFWGKFVRIGSTSTLTTCLLCGLILSVGGYYKLTTHILKTRYCEIEYRGKLDPIIASGLVTAEIIEKRMPEKAFEIYANLANANIKQLQAMSNAMSMPALTSGLAELTETPIIGHIPTFGALLNSGDIAPGKEMILGYEHGNQIHGSFLDIYSAAIAGESGSGKTSTMLFLIGSGLITQNIKFLGIDPHYPHPKSLGFKTRPLWEAGLIRMATDKPEMFEMLQDVEDTITNRLKQVDKDKTPVVLVIDELAFLSKESIGPTLAHAMEKISTEGRKCAVYMLASSQTWLASRTSGKEGSSVIRDTLTSAYVHRIKPKQANLLLQDKAEADKVKKYVKQAGEVLLCPVNDESVVCKMPYTTERDMESVVAMIRQANGQDIVINTHTVQDDSETIFSSNSAESIDTPEKPGKMAEKSLSMLVEEYLAIANHTAGKLAKLAGIRDKDLSQWRTGKTMQDDRKNRIEMGLTRVLCKDQEKVEKVEKPGKMAEKNTETNLLTFKRRIYDVKKFALLLMLLLASCTSGKKEQSEPTQTPKTVRVMTIRTIDDGGWFGIPTHEIYIDEPDGGRKDGIIDDDGTLRFGTEEYVISETVN